MKLRVLILSATCLFASAAPGLAADPAVDSQYDWTGGFIGIQAGYGWGDSQVEEIFTATGVVNNTLDYDHDGFVAGFEPVFARNGIDLRQIRLHQRAIAVDDNALQIQV